MYTIIDGEVFDDMNAHIYTEEGTYTFEANGDYIKVNEDGIWGF